MAKITTEPYTAWTVTGSPERVLDRGPSGVLWWAQNHDDDVYFWYSRDEGNTWSNSGKSVDVLNSFYVRAMHIDNAGHMHTVGRTGNTTLRIFRGHPDTSTTFTFDTADMLQFSAANEALAPDAGLDMIAWRIGSGYKIFVLFGTTALSGGVYTNTLRMAEITVSQSKVISLTKLSVLRTDTAGSMPYGCLTFQHTGDGKTPSTTPHVYAVTSVNTQDTSQAAQDDLQLVKFTYESGNYTQGASVTLEAAVDTTNRVMRCSYDGARVVTVYGTCNRATGVSSAAIHEVDWVEASGAVTRNDPPAYGGGYPIGVSSAVDPVSDDIYAVAYGSTNTTPVWSHYSRTSAAWSAWSAFGSSLSGWTRTGRVSLKQYVQKSAIEAVYATGSASPWTANYTKLTVTNSAPSSPQLLSPAPSSVADIGTQGAVFSWRFVDPDPGDIQGGWQMRRRVGSGAYSYYTSATQTWGTTAVWNTGADQSVTFPAGVWTNGNVWAWSVNTRDAAGLASGFASDVNVNATVSPAVAVLSPLAIYALDSSPIVTWSYASANPQRTYQIRVFDLVTYSGSGFDPGSSTPVWDSTDVPSVQARSTRIGVSLLNQGTYRAYMRVSDSNGLYSGWTYGEFLLSLTPGPTPTVEAVVENSYISGLARVRLTIQGLANMLSADQAYDHPPGDVQWEATNCTVGNSPNGVVTQTLRSLSLTSSAAGAMSVRTYPGTVPLDTTGAIVPNPRDFPARSGQVYTAIASFTAAATPRNVRVTLSWWAPGVVGGTDDTLRSSTTGTFLADMVGYPVQASVTGTCPLGADRVRLTVEVLGVTVANEVHYVDGIDLHPGTSVTYSPGGLLAQQSFVAQRLLPTDTSGSTLRTVNQVIGDSHQRLIAYDREMPFGTPVDYLVQAVTQLTSGQTLASNPSLGARVEVDSDIWAIRDPNDPTAEARGLVTDHEIERDALTTVYRPAGRALPLVESQGSTGDDASKMSVWVSTVAERRIMRDLLNRQTELIVQSPSGDQWYAWITTQKTTAGDGQGQTIDITYVEVDAP